VILWGGTGQAKVVRPIIERNGARVVAVFDDTPGLRSPFDDVPVFLGDAGFKAWLAEHGSEGVGFCVAIGNPHGRVRLRLHERLVSAGLVPTTIAHHTACIEPNAVIGEGSQLMAGAFVGAEARIGRQCIINTKASVDHEDVLEDGVEIAPGATLCGSVHVDINGWICAGATVLPRIRIGADAIVGAGAVVTRHVDAGTVVVGVPAHPKLKEQS
jgi:sugar O-acyltransferase (sialic acid O-acetyltransferase NeuD family)